MDSNSSFKAISETTPSYISSSVSKYAFEKNLLKNRSSSFMGNKLPQPPALQNSLLTPVPSNSGSSFSQNDSITFGSGLTNGSQNIIFPDNNLLTLQGTSSHGAGILKTPSIPFNQASIPGIKFNQQLLAPPNNHIKPLKHSLQNIQFINPFQPRDPLGFNSSAVNLIQRERSLDSSSSSNIFFKQDFPPLLKNGVDNFQQQPQILKNSSTSSGTKQSFNSINRFYNEIFSQPPKFENYSIKYDSEDQFSGDIGTGFGKKKKPRPKCDLCNKTFSRQSSLKTHITTVHNRIKNYECPLKTCNKRFSTNSNMRRHIRIHEKNKQLNIKSIQVFDSQAEKIFEDSKS
ncbi:hypothetical protein QEN19_001681 [Hanseniaspora menglaensis]